MTDFRCPTGMHNYFIKFPKYLGHVKILLIGLFSIFCVLSKNNMLGDEFFLIFLDLRPFCQLHCLRWYRSVKYVGQL